MAAARTARTVLAARTVRAAAAARTARAAAAVRDAAAAEKLNEQLKKREDARRALREHRDAFNTAPVDRTDEQLDAIEAMCVDVLESGFFARYPASTRREVARHMYLQTAARGDIIFEQQKEEEDAFTSMTSRNGNDTAAAATNDDDDEHTVRLSFSGASPGNDSACSANNNDEDDEHAARLSFSGVSPGKNDSACYIVAVGCVRVSVRQERLFTTTIKPRLECFHRSQPIKKAARSKSLGSSINFERDEKTLLLRVNRRILLFGVRIPKPSQRRRREGRIAGGRRRCRWDWACCESQPSVKHLGPARRPWTTSRRAPAAPRGSTSSWPRRT